ncbi:IS110 family RNA-guided transposase [Rhodococcus wratislaviensis]
MAKQMRKVYGGVDTHGRTHHAAAIDGTGRVLGDREFPATPVGYRKLISWFGQLGDVAKVGIEGTGSYGAGLARAMAEANMQIVEVDRPDRRARRRKGKSDPLDALAAARAALSGEAAGIPKTRSGPVEAIRALRVARRGAIKARTAAFNQLHGVIVSAPAGLRAALAELRGQQLVDRCAAFRIDDDRIDDPTTATKAALRAIARRIIALQDEIQAADRRLAPLTTAVAPRTAAIFGVGAEVAGQMLVTAGDNPERLRNEAAFAHLCAVAPIPASSGRTDRHRLNRGGDRAANTALYMVVVTRMRRHQPTRAYVARRTAQGLSKSDIMRCLKRFVVREIYHAIRADFEAAHAT